MPPSIQRIERPLVCGARACLRAEPSLPARPRCGVTCPCEIHGSRTIPCPELRLPSPQPSNGWIPGATELVFVLARAPALDPALLKGS